MNLGYDYEDSGFIVTLISPTNEQHNSSFSTSLAEPINFAGRDFEVALLSLIYTEGRRPSDITSIQVNTTTTPSPNVAKKFFDPARRTVRVGFTAPHSFVHIQKNELNQTRQVPFSLRAFCGELNNKLKGLKFPITVESIQSRDKTVTSRITIEKIGEIDDRIYKFPLKLVTALGFQSVSFRSGEHISEKPQSDIAYRSIGDSEQLTIEVVHEKYKLIDVPEPPTYSWESLTHTLGQALADTPFRVSHNSTTNRLTFSTNDSDYKMLLPTELNTLLGLNEHFVFQDPRFEVPVSSLSEDKKPLLPAGNGQSQTSFGHVTINIVQPQLTGTSLFPVLRTFARDILHEKQFNIEFAKPVYLPVTAKKISSITVQLLDSGFQLIPSYTNSTVVTLHFRPRRI